RLVCPSDSAECKPQPARPADDGCGQEPAYWFTDAGLPPKPSPPAKPQPGPGRAELPPPRRQDPPPPWLLSPSDSGPLPRRRFHIQAREHGRVVWLPANNRPETGTRRRRPISATEDCGA